MNSTAIMLTDLLSKALDKTGAKKYIHEELGIEEPKEFEIGELEYYNILQFGTKEDKRRVSKAKIRRLY